MIIMYHYINSLLNERENFNYISLKKFNSQIQRYSAHMPSNEKDIFKKMKTTFSFDDGLKEHLYAAEILKKNNKIGIFFIPTLPIENKKFLDVHKAHIILSKLGPKKANEIIKELYPNFEKLIQNNELYPFDNEKDDRNPILFKFIVNYSRPRNISKNLDEILKKFFCDANVEKFYLNKKEIKYIQSLGMIIGAHTHSHKILANLNYNMQCSQIAKSKKILSKIIKKEVLYFSYPYGNSLSYNEKTIQALKKNNIKYAFRSNLSKKKYSYLEIPRLDCSLI